MSTKKHSEQDNLDAEGNLQSQDEPGQESLSEGGADAIGPQGATGTGTIKVTN